MNKQLLVVGFHRSGTSMLAQEFYNSGLFLGDKLLEPHISNADGHFEDKEVFTLHEKILNLNNSNWMYSFPKNLITPLWLKDYMQNFINKRNQKHNIWGFKDPRTALFLNEWHNKLSNPYIVVIYRHYNETTQSLLYRDARAIAYNQNSNIDLFKDIELAYKMWLSYNKAILEYIEKKPKNSIVVSHQEVIKGFPIVQTTMDKFNLDLQKPKSSIKKELISPKSFSLPEISKDLKNELEEVWERLQKLSIAPAFYSDIKKDNKNISLSNFKQHLEVLNIETVENRGIDKVIDFLNDLEKSIEEKIEQINKNIPLFINFQKTNLLIDSIEKLITKYPKNITLNTIIVNIYKNEKNFDKAKEYALKIFDISDKIYPYFYRNLALINFEEKNFTEAFFNINKAIELNPNNFWFYHTLSLIEFNTGKTEKSLENINKAIDLLKNDKNMNMNILFNFYKTKIMFLTFYNKNIKETFDNLEKDLPKEKIEDLKKQFIYKNKEVQKEDRKDIVQSLQKNNLYYEKITSLYENLDIKAQSLFLEFIVYYLNQLIEDYIDPREKKDPFNRNGFKPFPSSILISAERSGLNLIRHIIESLTKHRTPGKVHKYSKGSLLFHRTHYVFSKDISPGRTRLLNNKGEALYEKVIILLRDPRETFVRAYNKNFDKFQSYCDNIKAFDSFNGEKLIIYYDELISNDLIFEKIFNFLDIKEDFEIEKIPFLRKEAVDWYEVFQNKGGGSKTKGELNKLTMHQKNLTFEELCNLSIFLKEKLPKQLFYFNLWNKNGWLDFNYKYFNFNKINITNLKFSRISAGLNEYSKGKKSNFNEHMEMVEKEFSGKSYLEFYHSYLIVNIRREIDIENSKKKFFEIWEKETNFLIKNLSLRWLISASDTFIDYSSSETDKNIAIACTLLINTIKLYETERKMFNNLNYENKNFIVSVEHIFDGLTTYQAFGGDMIKNMFDRINTLETNSIMIKVLKEILNRINSFDTIFSRMKKLQKKEEHKWWLKNE